MKVTIEVPAPSKLMEDNSRLRQKIRNYRLTLRQLQRAHYITKDLLRRAEARENLSVLAQEKQGLETDLMLTLNELKVAKHRIRELEGRLARAIGPEPMQPTFVPNGNGHATEEKRAEA